MLHQTFSFKTYLSLFCSLLTLYVKVEIILNTCRDYIVIIKTIMSRVRGMTKKSTGDGHIAKLSTFFYRREDKVISKKRMNKRAYMAKRQKIIVKTKK